MVTYEGVLEARFLSRHRRFTAAVMLGAEEITAHVPNTGRCSELLPGARVVLAKACNPARKTAYSLTAVYKGDMLVNIDSQAPNSLAAGWLAEQYPGAEIRREVTVGDSRIDFHVSAERLNLYVEVKGCTLEKDELALFPDTPTLRGTKHLRTLTACAEQGAQALVLFVIQMQGVRAFTPHDSMDPAFGQALREAAAAGVMVRAVNCRVAPGTLSICGPVPVLL